MTITKCVDCVRVTLQEAQRCVKVLYKIRKSIKDKADLERRFDDYIRQLRANGKGGNYIA